MRALRDSIAAVLLAASRRGMRSTHATDCAEHHTDTVRKRTLELVARMDYGGLCTVWNMSEKGQRCIDWCCAFVGWICCAVTRACNADKIVDLENQLLAKEVSANSRCNATARPNMRHRSFNARAAHQGSTRRAVCNQRTAHAVLSCCRQIALRQLDEENKTLLKVSREQERPHCRCAVLYVARCMLHACCMLQVAHTHTYTLTQAHAYVHTHERIVAGFPISFGSAQRARHATHATQHVARVRQYMQRNTCNATHATQHTQRNT